MIMNRYTAILFFSLLIIVSQSCTKSAENDIPGEWWAAEIQIEADTTLFDQERISTLKKMEQSVYFVFNEDKTMEAITGAYTNKGTWSLDKEKNEVFVLLEGSRSNIPSLFGTYEDGKIVAPVKEGPDLTMKKTYVKR